LNKKNKKWGEKKIREGMRERHTQTREDIHIYAMAEKKIHDE
jgi:hypothetical protein